MTIDHRNLKLSTLTRRNIEKYLVPTCFHLTGIQSDVKLVLAE